MLKEAIEKIEEMASKPTVRNIGGWDYIIDKEGTYIQVKPDIELPEMIRLTSLDAVVAMIKNEAAGFAEAFDTPIFVSVPTHDQVEVFAQPSATDRFARPVFYKAVATDIPGWDDQVKLPFDQAAVALQTRFQDSGDRDYTIRLLSMITTGAKVTYNDTGVATTVVTQKGVALQESSNIKPLVRLRPYRTFQEVEQPEGLFLIRIDERGITFTEADGGMWKLTARRTIKAYLEAAFADWESPVPIVVML